MELPIDDICARLLDSEEHACEAAIPPVAEYAVEVIQTLNADYGRLEAYVQDLISHRDAARLFVEELLGSVETLTGVADLYGARTLADLLYLHSAIASGSSIDHNPDESRVLEVVKSMPSGEQWAEYLNLAHPA